MIGSVILLHMALRVDIVDFETDFSAIIPYVDEWTVKVVQQGSEKVMFMSINGPKKLKLSEKLVDRDASISLLSVPALTKKIFASYLCKTKAFCINCEMI